MKKLKRISFDTLLTSLTPIVSWIFLSIFLDKSLINIFLITYPIQYISSILKSVFGIGANISEEKYNVKDDILSGMFFGLVFSLIIYVIIILNLSPYINFMHEAKEINKLFLFYSVSIIFLQTILSFVLDKLYFECKNLLANKYTVIFNFINIFVLILTTLIFKNDSLIVFLTLISVSIYTFIIYIKSFRKFKIKFDLLKWIKYDSIELTNYVFLFLTFLFGISTATNYGSEYALAFTFVALITDIQWDITDAISTVTKIDLSENTFNYKKSINNAYILVMILVISSFIMYIVMHQLYKLNIIITSIYLLFHFIDFIICPIHKVNTTFLHLEYSEVKMTIHNIIARIIRLILSFLPTPFCVVIGQLTSAIYQTVMSKIIFIKHFKLYKNKTILRRN